MATQNDNWWSRDVAASGGATFEERKGEAGIASSQAGARSSEASAREKEATLPAVVRKETALASKAETEAEQAAIALRKAKQLASGMPTPQNLGRARREVLVELRNLAEAKRLSQSMFGATGFGHSTTSVFGGSPAATVESLLQPVQANAAFSALQKMREESPTGGALGNVTERELGLLYSKEGSISPTGSDETFQRGADDLIANRIEVLNKLNADPAEVAEALGAENIDKFAPMISAYRLRPEDETALNDYVKTSKAKGAYDPTDFAALMAQAYQRATGNAPDEAYVANALRTGQQIGAGKATDLGQIDYSQADVRARQYALDRVKGAPADGLTWGQALGGGAVNLIPSTFQLAADTVAALTVDLPDTLDGVGKIVAGATGMSDDETAWNAVKDYYADRYGSIEGFKKALREDPASILADVAGIATGGSTLVAKTAGTVGRVGRIAALSNAARAAEGFGQAAAAIDPLVMAARTAKTGAKAAGRVAEGVGLGLPARAAGVTTTDVKQAFQAGREGSPEFVAQMTGEGAPSDPIAKAQQAVTELYQQRSNDYTRRMSRLKREPETLAFDDVEKAIEGVRQVGRHRGIDISTSRRPQTSGTPSMPSTWSSSTRASARLRTSTP